MGRKEAENYISLREATEFCTYSHEYLRLRARNNKLKAKKIGRNWVTTRKWLNEYSCQVREYKESLQVKKQSRDYFFVALMGLALVILTAGFIFGKPAFTGIVDGWESSYYVSSALKDFKNYGIWLESTPVVASVGNIISSIINYIK